MPKSKKTNSFEGATKPWPADCLWPEPVEDACFLDFEEEDITKEMREKDPILDEYMEIKEYYDDLRDEGILDEDYVLVDFWWKEPTEDTCEAVDDREFYPRLGEDFWEDDRFDLEYWNTCVTDRFYKQKLDCSGALWVNAAEEIGYVIGYSFVNENLLRQAFTRKSFAREHPVGNDRGNDGSSEELEFFGDRVLEIVVTKELARSFCEVNNEETGAPFEVTLDAAQLTEYKTRLVCKEYLARRAEELGLDQYILYGTGDIPGESAKEDMMEAVIGAVAADCDWNMEVLEEVVDRMVNIQFETEGRLIRRNMYDILNAWHLRHFQELPEYNVYKEKNGDYICRLDFRSSYETPETVTEKATSRSLARSAAAEEAVELLGRKGLWRTLSESGIEPDYENSINQWQELYQKKYVSELPVYEFELRFDKSWNCHCECETVFGFGTAKTKVAAKKKAAFMALVQLYREAGMQKNEW